MTDQGIIEKENIIFIDASTKKDALSEITSFLNRDFIESDVQSMAQAVFYRETLMSTGIGLGIGVPHARTDLVSEPLILFALCKNPLSDYESMDGVPVRYIVMIFTGLGQHKEHTMIMSKVVSTFRRGDTLARLSEAKTADEVYEIMGGES